MQPTRQHSWMEIVHRIYKDILPLRPGEVELIVCQHKLLSSKARNQRAKFVISSIIKM